MKDERKKMTDYDYSESTYLIGDLRNKVHEALLNKRWDTAHKLSITLVIAAEKLQNFCLNRVKHERQLELPL